MHKTIGGTPQCPPLPVFSQSYSLHVLPSFPCFPLCFLQDPVHFLKARCALVILVVALVPLFSALRVGTEEILVTLITGIPVFSVNGGFTMSLPFTPVCLFRS